MPRSRRPHARRRPHAPRLVAPARGEGLADPDDWRIGDPESRSGWRVGLAAAGYLRQYFPAFWAAHVAQKPVTTARLLGVYHAFLELGHRELLAIDLGIPCPLQLGVKPVEILKLIDGYRDEGGILHTLTHELWHWVWQPPVETYGLEADELAQGWAGGRHRLCLALLWMVRQTAWQQLGLSASQIRGFRGGRQVVLLPNLHPDVPMEALADALTWTWNLPEVDGEWDLGGILRLVCGATKNEFADISPTEARQDMAWWVEGIYDTPDRLAYERVKQQEARLLRRAYDALDKRVRREPPLLAHIADQIVTTAARVMAERGRGPGRPLIELTRPAGEEALCAV